MMTLCRTLIICLIVYAFGQAYAANTARLYDFEEGVVGSAAESVADKVDTLLFSGVGGNRGNYWVEVPGTAQRPLPEGGLADVVGDVVLTAPPLEAFFGAVEFANVSDGTSLDSPQPGSTIAASFDGATILEDFNTAEGSRGVFISESAYDNNAFVEAGVNTFEDFSIMAQGWVRPDSAWNGIEQTVWSVGDDQGRLRITADTTPVWEITGLGSAFEEGGLFPEIPVAFDEWTHIGIFRGGAGAEVYINGELVAGDRNPSEPNFIGTFATNISLGGESLEFETFRGLVDDFRISGFANDTLDPGEMDYCDAFASDPVCPFVRQPCDLVIDGQCDIADLDLLVRQVVRGSSHSAFDINGDGTVDVLDITDSENGWLAQAGEFFANLPITGGSPFLVGDANLDGVVDVSDFNVFNENKFSETGLWSKGDFNADDFTDVADFNAWNGNKFTSSSNPAAVPEPSGGIFLMIAAAMMGCGWRAKRR